MDRDHVFRGVEELLPIVGPGPGAGSRVGIKLHPETQALPFSDVSPDWTGASQQAKESLFWRGTDKTGLFMSRGKLKCLLSTFEGGASLGPRLLSRPLLISHVGYNNIIWLARVAAGVLAAGALC